MQKIKFIILLISTCIILSENIVQVYVNKMYDCFIQYEDDVDSSEQKSDKKNEKFGVTYFELNNNNNNNNFKHKSLVYINRNEKHIIGFPIVLDPPPPDFC